MKKETGTKENNNKINSRPSGKLSDLQKILKLALNSFGKEKYSMAIDYCRKALDIIPATDRSELAAEAYYIWCLANLKLGRYKDARKVCYEARLKLGNYLDLVYFEILIAVVSCETDRISKLINSFMELHRAADGKFDPHKEKTAEKIGELLFLGGKALEQAQKTTEAVEIYGKYLALFPDDNAVKERFESLRSQTGG